MSYRLFVCSVGYYRVRLHPSCFKSVSLNPATTTASKKPFAKLKAATEEQRMSKQEILNWSQNIELERNDTSVPLFDWTKIENDWDGFMSFAQKQITNSSTKNRIFFIEDRLVPLALRSGSCIL